MKAPDGKRIAFNAKVGVTLKAARMKSGASLRVLAGRVGVSSGTLDRIEEGITPCPLYVLAQIAEALDVTLDELVPTEATA